MTEKKDYMTEEFYKRYKKMMGCEDSILGLLKDCNDNVREVSRKIEYGLDYWDILNLCAGYTYGNEKLRENILWLLEDINYHYECGELENNTDDFIKRVLDVNSDYALEYSPYSITLKKRN